MSSTHRQLISTLIKNDKASIAQLKLTLQQECEALKTRNHSELPPLIEEKNRLLSELDRSSQQRASILKATNLPTTKESWEQLLRDMTDSETQAEWTWIQDELKACHTMNQVNGKLITRSRNTLGHLVNLLKGQVASPELYNQAGVKRPNSHTHTMIKA